MKKILIILSIFLFSFIQNTAVADVNWTNSQNVQRVNKIGKQLLVKNALPSQITFKVIESDEINAYVNGENELCVFTGLLKNVEDDSELAGVISHEIGHVLNSHVAKQTVVDALSQILINTTVKNQNAKLATKAVQDLSIKKMSRTEESEADITGVDLMVKAGYNPLAMVSVLYKISGNYFDFFTDHPSGDKRTEYVYNYILYTYPNKANLGYNSDSFNQFMAYIKPIIKKRNASPTLTKKFNKEQEKLKKKRIAKLKKYQNSTNEFGWRASYTLLQVLTQN